MKTRYTALQIALEAIGALLIVLMAVFVIVHWNTPVSYTHLDVYKRQRKPCAGRTAGYGTRGARPPAPPTGC